jgi:hypothetical protein
MTELQTCTDMNWCIYTGYIEWGNLCWRYFECISAVQKAGNPNHLYLPQRKHNVIPAKS